MESNAIEIRSLCKHYKGFSLDDLNLDLPYGCVLGLVGENGAGKSTTIRLIMDTLERDGGTVSVLGTDNRSKEFLDLKEDIGVVLDETFVPEVINAKQMGKIMAGTYKNWDQAVYDGWIRRFELPLDKKFKDYSRGMTMKLGIAAALSHHPRLLLLDEATAALDNQTAFAVTDAILHLDGLTRMVVTHRLEAELLEQYDEIFVLRGGEVCERGRFGELMERKEYFYSLYNVTNG